MNAKIISFFNHKGGVGKTTLVHNLAFALADAGQKVLLIDADPQMNLTAAMYGLFTDTICNKEELNLSWDKSNSEWKEYTDKYLSFYEYLIDKLIEEKDVNIANKLLFQKKHKDINIDLMSGSIDLVKIERALSKAITPDATVLDEKYPYRFEQAIREKSKDYDFILIDTPPNGTGVLNGLIIMSSDYFICPVIPSFFSIQAINNLTDIFRDWMDLFRRNRATGNKRGLTYNFKFLGIVVQATRPYNDRKNKKSNKKNSDDSIEWMNKLNENTCNFQKFLSESQHSLSGEEFANIFSESKPFIITECAQFTRLATVADKSGIPVIALTQENCRKYTNKNNQINIERPLDTTIKKDGNQRENTYYEKFKSITESYKKITEGIIKLKNI